MLQRKPVGKVGDGTFVRKSGRALCRCSCVGDPAVVASALHGKELPSEEAPQLNLTEERCNLIESMMWLLFTISLLRYM